MAELPFDLIEKYEEIFESGFPTIPLAWGRSRAELEKIINDCIKQGKDVYELGYVKADESVDY